MTAFYSWRLMFMTFYGPEKGDSHKHDHAHESPLVMLVPLIVLALGATFAGMLWYNDFFAENVETFFGPAVFTNPATNTVLESAHGVAAWVKVSPFIAMVFGFLLAYWFYIVNPRIPAILARRNPALYQFLLNKWYFDEVYDFLFVQPAKRIGRYLWKRLDGSIIDGAINGLAMGIVPFFTRAANKAQSGHLYTYAFAMIIGVVAIISWFAITGGAL